MRRNEAAFLAFKQAIATGADIDSIEFGNRYRVILRALRGLPSSDPLRPAICDAIIAHQGWRKEPTESRLEAMYWTVSEDLLRLHGAGYWGA